MVEGAVEFRDDLCRQTTVLQSVGCKVGVGRCHQKISAHRKENFCAAVVHRFDGFDRIEAFFGRNFE
jgi:hypothetical protein